MAKRKLGKSGLNPDEIFMDSENIPDFDKYQFEGRLEKPITKSTFAGIGICFLILGGLLFVKTGHLEILKGETYALRSKYNYLRPVSIRPVRGIIYDKNGKEIAWNDSVEEEGNLKLIRAYSALPGLSHVLGYVGIGLKEAIVGKDGIEKKYEDILGGTPGVKLVETNAENEIISESVSQSAKNGKSVKLTIDAELQAAFYRILEGVVNDRGFSGGAGVILDVNSGEVSAITSYPEFSSQVISRGKPESAIREYFENPQKPFFNRAVSGLYAPGSIIKPLIALAVLNEKIISSEKQILSTGSISIPNPFFPGEASVFMDWKAHGWVDMRRALAVSSNVYFYTVGGGHEDVKGLGINKIDKYAELFGFGLKTNIDMDKEEKGLIPSPMLKAFNTSDPVWRIGDTYNASIGQGDFQITPLQAAVYAAAITNSGRVLQPRLLAEVLNTDNSPADSDKVRVAGEGRTIDIPEEYFKIVREGMRMAVLEGTAQGLSGLPVEIAAKTGTAELQSEKNKFVNSWLIGFFPYKNPRFVLSVVLEHGKAANLIGGVFVGRQLFEWMIIHTPQYLTNGD